MKLELSGDLLETSNGKTIFTCQSGHKSTFEPSELEPIRASGYIGPIRCKNCGAIIGWLQKDGSITGAGEKK